MYLKNKRNTRTSTQKNFNLPQFIERYYNHPERVLNVFFQAKNPTGFKCECGNTKWSWIKNRPAYQCTCCCAQTYLMAGTIFHRAKLSPYQILLGIYFFVSHQSGISAVNLSNLIGCNTKSGQGFLTKLRMICDYENGLESLEDIVDIDGAYLGGEDKEGKRGRGSDKQPVLFAQSVVEYTTKEGKTKRYPNKVRAEIIDSESEAEVARILELSVVPGALINSDKSPGIIAINGVVKNKYNQILKDKDGSPLKKYPYTVNAQIIKYDENYNQNSVMYHLNDFISNTKSMIAGICHGINIRFLNLYLQEAVYKHNDRFQENKLKKTKKFLSAIYRSEPITHKEIVKQFETAKQFIIA